jgi:hypothetical protein
MDDGMLTAEDGSFFKHNLDIYKEANGEPNEEEKNMQISSVEQLMELMEEQSEFDGQQQDKIDPATGLPYDEVDKMKVDEIFDLLNERKR